MQVKQAMRTQIGRIEPDASLVTAAKAMQAADAGGLLVIDAEVLMGTLTDWDIVVRCVAEGKDATRLCVRDAMSMAAVCCHENQTCQEAMNLMQESGLMRLPVLNQRDEVVGIVSLAEMQGQKRKRKPYKVTFYKRMIGSAGQLHDVPMQTVYVSGVDDRDSAEGIAIEQFESNKHVEPWSDAADGYTVDQPPSSKQRRRKR